MPYQKPLFSGKVKVHMKGGDLRQYLTLFGLDESFTVEDLARAYRTLAQLNHPDHAGEEAHLRMVIINEAHRFLQEYRKQNNPGLCSTDPIFGLYKIAVTRLNDVFDAYYSHCIDKDDLSSNLREIKNSFAEIVHKYPSSDYFLDSVDRICSINKWLS